MKTNQIIVASLVGLTTCSSLVLASIHTYADNDTAVDEVEITVPVACTMTGTINTNHTATLTPGTYSGASTDYANGIGKTTLTTFCNDNNGFSIYAIGFTGDTEGANTLVGANTGATIATKAYESTDTQSNWSMKVTKVTDTTQTYNPNNMTITNSYDSWHAVPDDYTKVAEYKSTTEPATTDTTLGAKVETTYATYVATNQPADTYTGKVKYVMVHPYNATAPEIPISIAEATTMQEVSTKTNGGCPDTLTVGQVYTLTDSRDSTQYRVARLADGNCWMLDNLALDIANSSVQVNLSSNTTNATDITLNYLKGITSRDPSTDPDGKYAVSGASTDWPSEYSTFFTHPLINNLAKDIIPVNSSNEGDPLKVEAQNGNWKSGIYYNFCAASAGSYCYSNGTVITEDATEDICPKNWRIPTGGNNGEYQVLYNNTNYNNTYKYRSALQLPLSGWSYRNDLGWDGSFGYWPSSTRNNNGSMYGLAIDDPDDYRDAYVQPSSAIMRTDGNTLRCILGSS